MNFNSLLSSDFWYEISAAGVHVMSPETVGIILGTTQDLANYITIAGQHGDAINMKDYLLKQVPYALKPAKITITGTVKVLVLEKINS